MRIAVSYDAENKQLFGHFGHAPAFQIFEVQDGTVTGSEVIEAQGMGHAVMVALMKDRSVDVVLAGSMGGHAVVGLKEAGIQAFVGAEGTPEEAVQDYLQGKLPAADENAECHHDHEEEHHCCGACHGGERPILFPGKNAGKKVQAHYRGTFNDGTQFDASYDRGEPLAFIAGVGQMIPGFDRAVVDMEVGQEVDIHLSAEEAYGEKDPDAIFTFAISELPGSEALTVGQQVYLGNSMGQPVPVTVLSKDAESITLDANHEMAGKELNFHIALVSVEEA